MNLTLELSKVTEEFVKNTPADIVALYQKEVDRTLKLGIEERALRVGDTIPAFTLNNAIGEKVNVYDLLKDGPLIISFYRGGWCPWCNLELRAYQESLAEIKNLGAQLVAISPETPDNSLTLIEKHSLKYTVLSDVDLKVAEAFGITFKVALEIDAIYNVLFESQGTKRYELPVPATYVVDSDGRILLDFVSTDYKKRLDPKEAIEVLRTQTY